MKNSKRYFVLNFREAQLVIKKEMFSEGNKKIIPFQNIMECTDTDKNHFGLKDYLYGFTMKTINHTYELYS